MLDSDIRELWAQHEDIAIHFNDLLMKLRLQSLAGIAAVSTLVGIFTKEGVADAHVGWMVATAIFVALALFWIAIWCLDFFYYNRLLMGAVAALTQLERDISSGAVASSGIKMSTMIEGEFKKSIWPSFGASVSGVLWFYGIVLAVILAGAIFCARMYCAS
jgi:hypothetical protein